MIRALAAAAALAACSGSSSTPQGGGSASGAAAPVAAAADASAPIAKPPAPAFRVQAPPGGEIALVAVTSDGGAALVADDSNGFRLYAALDASIEPVVVDLPPAMALALVRDGGGFVAAMLDDAGGVVVAALDRDGRVTHHVELAGVPPTSAAFIALAAAGDGFLASTSAHGVAAIAKDGTLRPLAAGDDEQPGALAFAKDRAAVVIETKKGKRVRRLALSPLAWGDWIAGADGLTAIALSPSGERIAGIAGAKAVAIDVATGKSLASAPAAADSRVGFVDDGHVAIAGRNTQLGWLAIDPKEAASTATRAAAKDAAEPVLATGGGRAISRIGADLVVATPAAIQYLGFRIATVWTTAPAGDGRLLIGKSDWAILDGKLDVIARPKPWTPAGQELVTAQHLGGDDWLVATKGPRGESICVDDFAMGTGVVARTKSALVAIDPTSKLITMASDGERDVEILRYAPDRHALDKVGSLAKAGSMFFVPVSPKLANGIALVGVEPRCETGCKIRWFRDLAHLDHSVDLDTRGYVIDAVDAAGHVFVYEDNAGAKQVAIYSDGKQLATRSYGDRNFIPDPTGTRYIGGSSRTMTLVAIDGREIWSRPALRGQSPIWLDDGSLVLATGGGIVRLDPATGDPLGAKCGWRFELAVQPSGDSPIAGDSVCRELAPKRDVIEIPGDAAFKKLARDVASASAAEIFEWGSYPIGGRVHRAATIIPRDNDSLIGFLVEVSPGKAVTIVFRVWGGSDYQRPPPTDLRWTVGAQAALTAGGGEWGTAYREDALVLHARWIHGSSENIDITLRETTPVVFSWSWAERENVGKGHYEETQGGKQFGTKTSCAGCPAVATFKPHAGAVAVRGPSAKADELLVAPDPSWDK